MFWNLKLQEHVQCKISNFQFVLNVDNNYVYCNSYISLQWLSYIYFKAWLLATFTSKLGYLPMSIIYYNLMQYMFISMLEFYKNTCSNTDILFGRWSSALK